jgi:predicted nucleic acid-binding protein
MKYVHDASVALKWVLIESDTAKARQVREDFRNGLHALIAPDSFAQEIAHALTKAERRGMIPDAAALWTDVMTTAPLFFRSHSLIPRAIQVASQLRIGVYDCLYVALAERETCDLLTADTRLVNSLRPAFSFITSLASLP